MWWPFSKREEPKVIHTGERKRCWDARDKFFECLDAHQILDPAKDDSKARKACPPEIKEFEQACVDVWIDYFKQKRVADHAKLMRIKELEKRGYEPLNSPLQARSVDEE